MPVDAGTRFDTNFFDREIGLSTFMELSHGRFPVRRRQAGSQRFSVSFLVRGQAYRSQCSPAYAWQTRFDLSTKADAYHKETRNPRFYYIVSFQKHPVA